MGKSYKNKGWAVQRSYLTDLIPVLKYEKECKFILDDYKVSGKLNLHTRLFYKDNTSIPSYLFELFELILRCKLESI